jgi:hypothetical protein
MALLNIFVFCLPQHSGERIGFAVTFLLAVVVFMTIAQSLLPATAMPRLSAIYIILMTNFMMSVMIVVSVIVSAWFYYQTEDVHVHDLILKIGGWNILSCLCKARNQVGVQDKKCNEDEKNDWHIVARFWDRLSFIFYLLCFIVTNSICVNDVRQGT